MSKAAAGRRYHAERRRPTQDPQEVELKFQLSADDRIVIEASNALSALEPTEVHQITTYFDTPKGVLDAAGITLRVRTVGGIFIQTVKSRDQGTCLASIRGEWECEIASPAPDLSRLGEVPQLAEMVEYLAGGLNPMFVTDVQRTIRTATLGSGCVVEVAIDTGKIEAGSRSEPIFEIELELKAGPPGPMYVFARILQSAAPMWISTESKATRGWRLRTGQTAAIRLATAPLLDPDADATQGFRHILHAAMGHLTANIGPTLRGDPEGLHQMRIALRAARATLQLFAPALDRAMVAQFDDSLQAVCRTFGIARDWDVFCLETLPEATRALPSARLGDLVPVAEDRREQSHRNVNEIVRGPHFTAMLLALATWAEPTSGSDRGDAVAPAGRNLGPLAPELLARVAAKTRKRGRKVTRLSPERLHRFRKALDRLCSDCTALAALFPNHRETVYHARCVALQGILGAANDAVVAQAIARRLSVRPDLMAPVEALLDWSKARRAAALTGLQSATHAFRSGAPFWS
ncbi:CYTH and CHAD domain-containing protein [Sphingomonas faeni]|uniref:CYTH and CHAD domain-containing protein n=1 Tax=Sphingomonas faeni TaxID=185950 RepID=UPI0020C7C507|nr:CYTH and CHAD domain-containing protein [Sphingomonas faeni]MCP8891630.1 CHAD domain-containing protein [Sphingomonas faeni]